MGCNCGGNKQGIQPVPYIRNAQDKPVIVNGLSCPKCMSPLGKTDKGNVIIFWCTNKECDYRLANS